MVEREPLLVQTIRAKGCIMKQFLFFTREGSTFDPLNKPVSNLQILGDSRGENVNEAFIDFKKNQSYLSEYAFKRVIAIEYIGEFIYNLELGV